MIKKSISYNKWIILCIKLGYIYVFIISEEEIFYLRFEK